MCVRSYARKCQYFHRMAGSSPKSLNDDVSLEEVQELVRTGEVDVKETDCDGNNILHKICSLNTEKSDVVEYLISVGAAVNQVNSEGCTALIVCAGKGYLNTLRVLIKCGACVNPHGAVKQGHDSAVLGAVKNGHEKCVTELIKHGADIWYRNDEGEILLSLACKQGFANIVKYCLEHEHLDQINEPLRYRDKSPLMYACENGHIECLKLLLKNHKYGNKDKLLAEELYTEEFGGRINLIILAAAKKHEECVLELMSHGADIFSKNSRDENLLMIAASNGLEKVVKEYLKLLGNDKIEQCNGEGETVVMLACKHKRYHCLHELVKSGKCHHDMINKVSKLGFTALMLCAQNGFVEGLKLLIQQKAKVDTAVSVFDRYCGKERNEDENSALLLAAKSKNEESVKILIDHGADIWYKNKKGENLLMLACVQGMLDTVEYCLSHGSFLQTTACGGNSENAMFNAYKNYRPECVKILLSGDQTKCGFGRNLLKCFCNAKVERPDIVELLLVSNNSMTDSVDNDGCTPLMVCAQKGHLETMKVLIKHGACMDFVQCRSETHPSFNTGKDVRVRNTALLMAAEAKHEECVLELMNNGADIWYENNHGECLLTLASAIGLASFVKKCLSVQRSAIDKGVSLKEECEALDAAMRNNQEDCALHIINHDVDILSSHSRNESVLLVAL